MNDLLLLAALLPGPRHGYALKQQVGLLTGKGTLHNNLVYPLLRRFVENGWVKRRQAEGERGQTREVYALTAKGKRELLGRLGTYGEEEAASEAGFRLRVGLFGFLNAGTRGRILAVRDKFLAAREERLSRITSAMETGRWGSEVVQFFREQVRAEREWIARLARKVKREIRATPDA
jgi:DNA-binding PadR family transcriptional regulator